MLKSDGKEKSSTNSKCEICGETFSTNTLLENHLSLHEDNLYSCNLCVNVTETESDVKVHMLNDHNVSFVGKFCNHEKQCLLRCPKPPPTRKFKNGDGLTVLLPNHAIKSDIEKYELEFGDHECNDCNSETIWNETGSFYIVRSCGNNLVKFEDQSWWTGEGNFKFREQQTFSIWIDF